MCKKTKPRKAVRSANWHFNSADWPKLQNRPKYVLFRSKLIRFDFLGIKSDLIRVC